MMYWMCRINMLTERSKLMKQIKWKHLSSRFLYFKTELV